MKNLDMVLDKIEKLCDPESIFLYGSRAGSDYLENSDYEIGVLMREDRYVSRDSIKREIGDENFNVYPFRYEDFLRGKIDTPFQKSVYLYELVGAGKTLRGQEVIEKMDLPDINVIDLIQNIRLEIGFGLASVISNRNGDRKTTSAEFYKSCLFGLRCLEIIELKKFAFTYEEIFIFSKGVSLGKCAQLVSNAYSVRTGGTYGDSDLFRNISFLNEFIESKIIEKFENDGNVKLI